MPEDSDEPRPRPGSRPAEPARGVRQGQRNDRLKRALRENLKRRKSQARGRDDTAPTAGTASSDPGDAAPLDSASSSSGGLKKPGD